MITRTATETRNAFAELPARVRQLIVAAIYLAIAFGLVHFLGLEGGSVGGWTGIGNLPGG